MGNFNKGKFSGNKSGGRNFGGDRGGNRGGYGGGRDHDRRPEMHRATCSECGKSCEVPFRPSGDKPVFCSDCFENKGGNNSRDSRDRGDRNFDNKDSRPRFADKRPQQNGGGGQDYTAELRKMNDTLNKILKALTSTETVEEGNASKRDRHEKAPKKEVDTAALKQTLAKAMKKKGTVKKVAAKKVKAVAKKPAGKKKAVKKKPVAKKKKK